MANHDDPPPGDTGPPPENPADEPHLELEAFVDGEIEDEEPLLPSREPLRRIFRGIGLMEQLIGGLLLFVILCLVLAQVAQRYIAGSWPWTGELARYSLVWATFLMAGYLIAYAPHHIAIHVVDYVAKGRWLEAVKLFVNVIILLTGIMMIYGNYQLIATDIGQVTPAGQMPLRYVNLVPLVGLVLVALRALLGILARDVPALLGRNEDTAGDAA